MKKRRNILSLIVSIVSAFKENSLQNKARLIHQQANK